MAICRPLPARKGMGRKPAVSGAGPEGIPGRRAKPETMAQLTASRTLVKSSPELWAECSDAASLARHLDAFGEIQITKLEPETAVAWEGEDVCGTVTLEPSGWGTRVVLTADVPTPAVGVGEPAGDVAAAPEAGLEPEPVALSGPVITAALESVAAVGTAPEPAAALESVATGEAESVAVAEPARPGFFQRLFGGWRRSADPIPGPDPDPIAESPEVPPVRIRARPPIAPVAPEPADPIEPVPAADPASPSAEALVGALDSLGRAHRRPFSRS